jgi:RNA polymerase sigma-70 factor (ECF subfamily)
MPADHDTFKETSPPVAVAREAELHLVRKVLERSPAALEQFARYLAAVPMIVAVHRSHSRIAIPDQEMPDLVQDCLLLIWRKLPEFEGRASLSTWIYRLCSFELCNAFRRVARNRRLQSLPDHHSAEPADRAQGTGDWLLIDLDLRAGLDHVGDAERDIIRLRSEGCTMEEIARHLGSKVGQVKAQYYRAIRRLQEYLEGRNWERES